MKKADNSIQKFEGVINKIAKRKRCSVERVFLLWYLETSFGEDAKTEITDGNGDGGIDALVYPLKDKGEKSIYVVQSRYCDDLFKGKTPRLITTKEFLEFCNIPSYFRNASSLNIFRISSARTS